MVSAMVALMSAQGCDGRWLNNHWDANGFQPNAALHPAPPPQHPGATDYRIAD